MQNQWKNSAANLALPIVSPQSCAPDAADGISLWRRLRMAPNSSPQAASVFDEFPQGAAIPPDEPTRRHFLQLMGASLALAGASGCDINQPQETIVPYVRAPEHIIPGKPLYYATAMTCGGASMGLLVETHMGRPIKVEGNPLHPAVPEVMAAANQRATDRLRLGSTDCFAQAVILSLYDPDRSQTVLRGGQIDTWDSCYTALRQQIERLAHSGGQGLRLLTEPVVSPTLFDQIQKLQAALPNAQWHQYTPIHDDNTILGARMAFGSDVSVSYLKRPSVVLSLDADCFADGPMRLQLARNFRWQELHAAKPAMSRLYVVETSTTITGAAADHRLATSPRGVIHFALALARQLGLELQLPQPDAAEVPQSFLSAVVEDLKAARGQSVVVAGRGQPPLVHAIAHWLNDALGNVGQRLEYRSPVTARTEIAVDSIRELASAIRAKQVEALIILGGNPAYDAPADLDFANALASVPFTLHLAQYADETSARCLWHVPELHLFESWSDTRANDGTASIVQPLIAPLYFGKTAHELLAALDGNLTATSYDLVRGYWQRQFGDQATALSFEHAWKTALHDGVVANTAFQPLAPAIRADLPATIGELAPPLLQPPEQNSLHISFRPDPSVWDGRFANNAWLQELPRPITKLTWDNALLLNPQMASAHRIKTGDIVSVETSAGRLEVPAVVVPGHPQHTVTLHLGYGRQRAGRVGNNVGADVYPLRTSDTMWFAQVRNLHNTGRSYTLAFTQHHYRLAGRPLVLSGTLNEYANDPAHPPFMATDHHHEPSHSLYPEPNYEGNKWGMVINQSACIGCNACVVACQAENNIPVVGKDQVWRGREMHWLRIDGYYADDPANPDSPALYHQPMLCQHCEFAPCEPVCPVAATTHSDEGLNEMTYNRCIGTRYCANNCPYKVRRFNFYDYQAVLRATPLLQLGQNPDVTVRSRGVMEKCTFCVQRINAARIEAKKEDRPIREGDVLTACQAACPTEAIVFGNLNDSQSAVRTLADSSLNYSVLGELNTRPRTTYLAVVRNPRPIEQT
jgi:molybdopterin-containing oxidoreductase family iron-sulfur binding subunit